MEASGGVVEEAVRAEARVGTVVAHRLPHPKSVSAKKRLPSAPHQHRFRAVPIRRRPGRPAARAARPPARPAGGGRPGILTAGIRPRCPLSPAGAPTDTRIRPLGRC